MKQSTAFVLASTVALAIAPAAPAASPAATQWVLSSAKVTGAGNEQFVTSLRIVNPGSAAADVDLTYLPQSPIDAGGSALLDNSNAVPVRVTVPAGQTLALEDVVGSRFGTTGAGGILVQTASALTPVSVVSRTFVANGRSAQGVPGTYGLSIPGQTTGEAIAVGDVGYIPYISSSPSTVSGFRSNVILLNTVRSSSVVNVRLQKADGSVIGQRDYTLGKLSAAQINNIGPAFGISTEDTNLTLVVTVRSGGPVLLGATVIDNAISSVNYAPPTKVALPNGLFGLILDDGGYGFSGRLDIVNGTPDFLSATVVLGCPSGAQPFILQGFTTGSSRNTTFTRNPDGSFSMSGSGSNGQAHWSGSVFYYADGTVYGRFTYSRATGSLGDPCAGVSKDIPFTGSKGASITP